jgi:transposase
MGTGNKTELRTFRFRMKDKRSACRSVHDRDVNAARNIFRLGRQALVEGISTLSAQC